MAPKFDEIKDSLNDSLHDDTEPWKMTLDLVEQKTGVPRVYIVIGKCRKIYYLIVFRR